MKPLIFGIIVLAVALIYHMVRNKEGFEDAVTIPNDVQEAMMQTMQKMPKDKLQQLMDKLNAIEKIEEPVKQMHSALNALQDLRPYYSYSKLSFDVFLLKFVDAAILSENAFKDDEINVALSEINRLKMIANVNDEMPSEKMLKAKQEASAAKEAEKKAKVEKKRLEKEKIAAEQKMGDELSASSMASPSIKQGAEFNNHRCEPPCPNNCESDDYIRKDSIPCWNCNLPRS
jgi:hypothetical protein